MKRWWRKRSMMTQLLLFGLVVQLIVLASFYLFQARVVTRALTDQAHAQARQTMPVLSSAVLSALAHKDYATVQAIAEESLSPSGIVAIQVKLSGGMVIANATLLPGVEVLTELAEPLKSGAQTIGDVSLSFSRQPLADLLADMTRRRALGAAAFLIFTSLGLALAARVVTQPVRSLNDASRLLASGQYDMKLGRVAGAELGELQTNFEEMARAIRHQFADLRAGEAKQKEYLAVAQLRAAESEAALLTTEAARAAADAARATADAARSSAEEARASAEEASRAKSEFLSKVSHEIRTPLNGLLGMVELLKDTELSASQRELTDIAHQSGHSLLAIINDILDFSKVQAGQFSVASEPLALQPLLKSATQLFAATASKKGVTLELDTAPDVPSHIVGDPLRLRQVLSNLISNAIKFTDGGKVSVSVWTQSGGDPTTDAADAARELTSPGARVGFGAGTGSKPGGPMLFVRVSDSGMGIEAASLLRIFEPFVQADNSSTRRFGGTGLGLSIVRSLVEAMGGGVSVASTPSKGSAFTVRLPLVVASVTEDSVAPVARIVQMPGLRVLLVEDNEINIRLASQMLKRFGCVVTAATDGRQGLERLDAGVFDVILMDCQMPVMDGFEATSIIRERERAAGGVRHIPVIAVTANASEADRQACLAHGMDDVVAKPYSIPALNRALARAVPDFESASGSAPLF